MKNKRGINRLPGSPALPGAGRKSILKTTIRVGQSLLLTNVTAGGVADLGGGTATLTKVGRDRLITVEQADGSAIRILVVSSGDTRSEGEIP